MQCVTRNKVGFTNFSLSPRFGYYFSVLTYGMKNKTGIPHTIHGNSIRTVQRTGSDCRVSKALLLTSTNINPVSYFVRDDEKIRFLSRITGWKLALGLRSWKWRIRAKPYTKISPTHKKNSTVPKQAQKAFNALRLPTGCLYDMNIVRVKTDVSHEMKIAVQSYF